MPRHLHGQLAFGASCPAATAGRSRSGLGNPPLINLLFWAGEDCKYRHGPIATDQREPPLDAPAIPEKQVFGGHQDK